MLPRKLEGQELTAAKCELLVVSKRSGAQVENVVKSCLQKDAMPRRKA